MKLTISKTRTFIPGFNGNKDCSPTEQIEVTIKNPTIAIKDKVFSIAKDEQFVIEEITEVLNDTQDMPNL